MTSWSAVNQTSTTWNVTGEGDYVDPDYVDSSSTQWSAVSDANSVWTANNESDYIHVGYIADNYFIGSGTLWTEVTRPTTTWS